MTLVAISDATVSGRNFTMTGTGGVGGNVVDNESFVMLNTGGIVYKHEGVTIFTGSVNFDFTAYAHSMGRSHITGTQGTKVDDSITWTNTGNDWNSDVEPARLIIDDQVAGINYNLIQCRISANGIEIKENGSTVYNDAGFDMLSGETFTIDWSVPTSASALLPPPPLIARF